MGVGENSCSSKTSTITVKDTKETSLPSLSLFLETKRALRAHNFSWQCGWVADLVDEKDPKTLVLQKVKDKLLDAHLTPRGFTVANEVPFFVLPVVFPAAAVVAFVTFSFMVMFLRRGASWQQGRGL